MQMLASESNANALHLNQMSIQMHLDQMQILFYNCFSAFSKTYFANLFRYYYE